MTSQAFVSTIVQPIIDLGYGFVARFLGQNFNHYRPTSNGPVLTNFNMIEQLNFVFDRDPTFSHREPKTFGDQVYYGAFDGTNTKIGDYFWDEGKHTFYVVNWEPLRPVELMRCNRVVSVIRPAASGSVSNGYGANTSPITVLSGWPCSIVSGGIGGRNEANTPGSVKDHGVIISLPYYVPIFTYDVIMDDINRRYVVSENEQTALGWRLLCTYEAA